MKHFSRSIIKNEIVEEFIAPIRDSNKVIILCGGLPGYPSNKEVMLFLAKKGFWVFSPRYRGSWESGGLLLKNSPHLDVVDVVNSIRTGFTDIWRNKKYKIKNPQIYIIGSSFGGAAAILASQDKSVKKIIALSPVIDWTVETKNESVDGLKKFTYVAFGNGYRPVKSGWKKLKSGKFYNPMKEVGNLDKDKIYIIHPKDDKVCLANTSIKFSNILGSKITIFNRGGHLSLSSILKKSFWNKISVFLK